MRRDDETAGIEGLTVRRATVDDVEAMVRLREAMQTDFGVADAVRFAEGNHEYFARKLPTEEFVAFVAEAEGEMVATSGMVVYEAPPTAGSPSGVEGYILNMYTVPERRGEGIASMLVERLIEYGKSLGARRLWLRTNAMGRGVYAEAGFVEDADYMRLRLIPVE